MGRPITVSVGPLATADADGVSTSQTAPAAQALAINGALTDGGTANNIAQSQTPGGAVNLTLNGTLVVSGVAYLGTPRPVYITCAGNNSGRTFTVTGTTFTAGGGPIAVVETVTGANTSIVATTKSFYTVTSISISGASTGAVTVGRGGLATIDKARRIIITSGGDDTGITFAITGTDVNGSPISESVTGVNNAVATSVLDYKTVVSVVTSAAAATTVEVGTVASGGAAASPWVRFDDYASMSQVSIQCTVTGTANYTVQQTMQDPNALDGVADESIAWLDHPDTALVSATTTKQGNYGYAPVFARVVLNSGTGSVSGVFRQAYLA